MESFAENIVDAVGREAEEVTTFRVGLILWAVMPPLLSYVGWDEVAAVTRRAVDQGQAINVDGNYYASQILAPTINGVVVPFVAIGLGTLVGATPKDTISSCSFSVPTHRSSALPPPRHQQRRSGRCGSGS